jgi:propanol-preferring alcohol dehydrogenase
MLLSRLAPVDERPLELVELPDPEPGPGEIRIAVRACGVCRTDLHVVEGDLPEHTLPIIPGHQVVGRVDALGPGRAGDENLCADSRYTGYHAHGGYAELAVVAEDFAYGLPEGLDELQAAPLLCAGIIGYRALQRAEVPSGGRVALYGFGSSAHVVLQIARHRGCEVHVVTRGETHRELARRMGAHWVGGADEAPPVEMDSAIIFAPAGEIVPHALGAVRKGGTVALAGIYMTAVPELEYEAHLFHEKNLRSVEANTRKDGQNLLREAIEVPVRANVTRFALEEANEALIRLKSDAIDGSAVLVVGS